MDKFLDAFQELLLESNPSYSSFQQRLKNEQGRLWGIDFAKSHILLRTAVVWQAFNEGRAGTADLAILLRQMMRTYSRELKLKISIWEQLAKHQHDMSIRVVDQKESQVTLRALSWKPAWLDDTNDIDRLVQRRPDTTVPGDGLLYAVTSKQKRPFLTYRSYAQKTAVEAALFAPPGSTILVTLPTGGGKSMCILLPAWYESHGGRRKGGTTLVIVPTVALAHDQQENIRRYFTPADDTYKPHSLTGDTPKEIRATIYRGISEGTLPILYTSPEALLLNPVLYHTCLKAAENGNLKRLVIDEAHIVDAWGASFRTEFQLLSAYQRKLLKASGGQLRTLLLSATVSYDNERILEDLFASESKLQLILGNQLRPEPSYWFHQVKGFEEQRSAVMEALHHLPRPAILYVTRPNHAKRWVRYLNEAGFKRVIDFTGRTVGQDRRRIIADWNRNEIDLLVGTSAFGLGVDKADIRTIIHATLPENIDRFYQEVGRGGRDGFSSISLLVTKQDDIDLAYSMTTKSRITTGMAWSRWRGMWTSSLPYKGTSDMRLIDLDAKPSHNLEMGESDVSRDWNKHVLLFMQRASALSIEDTRPDEMPLDPDQPDRDKDKENYWLLVRIKNDTIVNNKEAFEVLMEQQRGQEKGPIMQNLQKLNNLAYSHSRNQAERCLAHEFAELYPQTAEACGGCSYCRQNEIYPYIQGLRTYTDMSRWPVLQNQLSPDLQLRMGDRQTVIIAREIDELTKSSHQLAPILVQAGIEQIIFPEELLNDQSWTEDLVKELSKHRDKRQRIVGISAIGFSGLFPVPTAAFYPTDKLRVDELYRILQDEFAGYHPAIPIVHVVDRGAWLTSENGRFMDRVNGLKLTPSEVQNLFVKSQISLY
jgi:superfamily II DNA/RNA helicase